MNKLFSFLFIILLLAGSVQAELVINKYTNDFTASSPYNEQLKLCSCETKVDRVIVENTGNFYADFTLDINSNYPSKIRVANPTFTLAPKHFVEVLIYIEDSCGISGEFLYDVIVHNSYGRTQILHRTIRSDICQTTQLYVTPQEQTVGTCKQASYDITVTNVGTFADTFTLDFAQYNKDATIENKAVYLQPGQSSTQEATYQFTCSDYGTKTLPINVYTSKNGIGAATEAQLTIKNEYEYALNLQTSANACSQTTTTIPFTIENSIGLPNEITFELGGPSFVTMPTIVPLDAHEKKELAITVNNPAKIEDGNYKLTINAVDKYGHIQKQRTLDLNINNCYDPSVEFRQEPEQTVTSPIQACCGPKTYYVNIRNNGDREQAFNIRLDGPSFFLLEETTVRLQPQQNINVPLRVTFPCVDEQYSTKVIVSPVTQGQITATAELVIDSYTLRSCHMVQIDNDEVAITNDATVIPIIIKNTGIEGGTYTVSLNDQLFNVQETTVTLLAGGHCAIHLTPKVNLSEQGLGRYIVQPTLTLDNPSIPYNEHVGIALQDKGLWQRFLDWFTNINWSDISICGWVVFGFAIIIIFLFGVLLMVYAGTPFFAEGLARRTISLLKVFLLFAIIVLLLMLPFLNAPSRQALFDYEATSTEKTVLEWYQNEELFVNMAGYFDDPDKDNLSYAVSQPQNIKATVDGSMLTLTPDHNFAGENTMVITASDERGGITDSPLFTLKIIPRKNLTFLQWVEVWCHHLVTFELVALLLLLFLLVLTIKERRPYNKNVLVVVKKDEKARLKITRSRDPTTKFTTKSRANYKTRYSTKRSAKKNVVARKTSSKGTKNVTVIQQPLVEIVYLGAKNGNTVHTPHCMIAKRIPKSKRIAFNTKKAALNAGLIPCRLCRPFERGM